MNLFDLLKNNEYHETPQIQPVIINQNGNIEDSPAYSPMKRTTLLNNMRNSSIMGKAVNALLGQKAQPTDNISTQNGFNVTVSDTPRVGGILRDIASGYQENRTTPLSIDNFGQNAGIAKRLGEGLGSAARLLDSPLGRGIVAYGASKMLGDDKPLKEALVAGITNRNYRTADQLFRNDLMQSAKQQEMNSPEYNNLTDSELQTVLSETMADNPNFSNLTQEEQAKLLTNAKDLYLQQKQQKAIRNIEENINNYKGYITEDRYKNLINSQQLRDNYAYKNMILGMQQQANEENRKFREMQFENNKNQQAIQNQLAWANLNQRQKEAAINSYYKAEELKAREEEKANNKLEKLFEKQNEYLDVENQLNSFENLFKSVNNPYRYRAFGHFSERLNTLSNNESNFNAQRTLLFNIIARKLGGEKGVLSDADIRRVEAALPSLSDTYQQKKAKMQAVRNLLEIKKGNFKNSNNSFTNIDHDAVAQELRKRGII